MTELPSGAPGIDETDAAPHQVDPAIEAEIAAYLESADNRSGEVYRALNHGLTPDEIAAELNVSTSNFVWNYRRVNEALLYGVVPAAPTVALQAARRVRKLLRMSTWSQQTRNYLDTLVTQLELRAEDVNARVVEDEQAQLLTETAEARDLAGIYVYALPHYLRYPFDPLSGRTLMKVGRSDSDVIQRFRAQTRTTALPEEPILLRIYRVPDGRTERYEREFHELLDAADHSRSIARTAGREWFVTSTRFLDRLARALDLDVEMVNDTDLDEA